MRTGNLIGLGPVKREYYAQYIQWLNDPEVTQYLIMYRPITMKMEEEFFNNIDKNENEVIFAIHKLGTTPPSLIGNCGISIDWKNRVGHVGIFIGDKNCWGKGFGTDAMRVLVKYGFETLNLNRMELDVYGINTRAQKSYIKVGFQDEGRKRQAQYINGEYTDIIIMGILREEWEKSNDR